MAHRISFVIVTLVVVAALFALPGSAEPVANSGQTGEAQHFLEEGKDYHFYAIDHYRTAKVKEAPKQNWVKVELLNEEREGWINLDNVTTISMAKKRR